MFHKFRSFAVATAAVAGVAFVATAEAHITFASGLGVPPPIANTNWVGTVNVPHGCSDELGAGLDSERVEVEIPAAFTGVRPVHSTFGKASVTAADGVVSKLTWTQAEGDVQPADTHLYQLPVRGRLPNAPFTTLEFRIVQFCANGTTGVWEGVDAAKVRVLPARNPGWNQYTIPTGVNLTSADVPNFFGDAQIVWLGLKGYSRNTETQAQIGRTSGASALVTGTATDVVLPAGSVIWVRY